MTTFIPSSYQPAPGRFGARQPGEPGPLFDKSMIKYPDYETPVPTLGGPNSVAAELQPPKWPVKNIYRFVGRDEMGVWNAIAALRNLVDNTMPEDQQLVVEAGAAEAIIHAMRAYPNHAQMQVCAADTLVLVAKVDAAARMRVIEAGGLTELAEAVKRCAANNKGDGEKVGKFVVNKGDFCKECLVKLAGKRMDPRNKKHIDDAIAAGVDGTWFDFKRVEPVDEEEPEKKAKVKR